MVWVTLATLLIIAAYILYIWALICIALPLRSGRQARLRANDEWSFAAVFTDDRKDSDYALLWQTQTASLQLLRSAGSHGIPITHLKPSFDEFAHVYPELSDGSGFPEWIKSLHRSGVAVQQDSQIVITAKGLFILEAVERMWANLPGPRAHHYQGR